MHQVKKGFHPGAINLKEQKYPLKSRKKIAKEIDKDWPFFAENGPENCKFLLKHLF